QFGGGDQAVDATSDDDRIGFVRHLVDSSRVELRFCGRWTFSWLPRIFRAYPTLISQMNCRLDSAIIDEHLPLGFGVQAVPTADEESLRDRSSLDSSRETGR